MKIIDDHEHHSSSPDESPCEILPLPTVKDECEICGLEHTTACCPRFSAPITYIKDTPVPSLARKSLPDGLNVKDMQDGAKTVVAERTFPKGTLFGPFVARTSKLLDMRIDFSIMIFGDDGESEYLETYDECFSNWMSFILPASCIEEQNLICFQLRNKIYFCAIKDLKPEDELRVWYAPAYAKKMGMDLLKNAAEFDHEVQLPMDEEEQDLVKDSLAVESAHGCEERFEKKQTRKKNRRKRKREPAVESAGAESLSQGSEVLKGEALPVSPVSLGARELRETWQCPHCDDFQESNVASYARHLMKHCHISKSKARVLCPYCSKWFRSESYNSNMHISFCKELHEKNRKPCDENQSADNAVVDKTVMPIKPMEPIKPVETPNSDIPALSSKEQSDTTEDGKQIDRTVVGLENGINGDPLLDTGKNSDPLLDTDNNTTNLEELADSFLTNPPVRRAKILDFTEELDFTMSKSLVDLYSEDCHLDKPTSLDMFNSEPNLLLAEAKDDFYRGGKSLFAQPTFASCDDVTEEERNRIVENLLSETEDGRQYLSSDFDMTDPGPGCGGDPENDKENEHENAKTKRKAKAKGGDYVCDICHKCFGKPFYLHRHLRKHTGEFRCFACQRVFARKESLVAHRSLCEGPATTTTQVAQVRCEFCPRKYSSLQTLEEHMKDHFCKENNWKCLYCGITSEQATSIQDHRCSSAQVLVSCLKCHKKCLSSDAFEQHKTKITLRGGRCRFKNYSLLCAICGHISKSKTGARLHKNSHEEKAFQCSVCQKYFARKDTLDEHMKTHSTPSMECPTCKKRFNRQRLFNNHMRTAHTFPEFACDICDKVFRQKGNMTKHRKTHVSAIECEQCGHMSANKYDHRSHLNTHLSHSHPCRFCTSVFSQERLLNQHTQRKHQNVYRCAYCPATFVYASRLRAHLAGKHAALRAEWDSPQAIALMLAPLDKPKRKTKDQNEAEVESEQTGDLLQMSIRCVLSENENSQSGEEDDPGSVVTRVGLNDLNANTVVNADDVFDDCSTVDTSGLQFISIDMSDKNRIDAENFVTDGRGDEPLDLQLAGINVQSTADDSTVWIEQGNDLNKSLSDPVNIMNLTLPVTYQNIDASGRAREDSTSVVEQTQHDVQGHAAGLVSANDIAPGQENSSVQNNIFFYIINTPLLDSNNSV